MLKVEFSEFHPNNFANPDERNYIEGSWTFETEVEAATENVKVIEINQEKERIVVESVSVSQVSTKITLNIPQTYNNPALLVYDSTGNKLLPSS